MIELKNISKTYHTGKVEVRALRGITLGIARGEFVAIMGASGSGKSTLLSILGFLDKPDSGGYRFMGRDVTGLSDDELSALRNRVAGFVFQQFHLLPRMTALGNAELPLVYAGKRHLKESAERTIAAVGLAHRADHYPSEMSGGEQQRVAIARSMVNDPLIIFADEPTGNLDSASEGEIMGILARLHEEGRTIIMVTHNDEVARYAQRVIRFRDGVVISDTRRAGKGKGRPARGNVDEGPAAGHKRFARAEFLDYLKQALDSIITHKLRSLLSMLGILIGVAAVISMLALGAGASESITKSLSALGSNLLTVMPGAFRQGGVALEAGTVTRFTLQDVKSLAQLPEARRASPAVQGRVQLVAAGKNWNSMVQGVGVEYESMRAASPVAGRFFTEEELRSRKKVALVGSTVIKNLFEGADPIGQAMKINRVNFTIIGILPPRGASFFRDQDDLVIVPVTTGMYRLLGKEYVDSIDVEVRDGVDMDTATEALRDHIIKTRHLAAEKEDSFQIRDMTQIREALSSTTRTMSFLLGAVAAISLLVGGIGIMNIMLVSVKERTREIGLRKAIGARGRDVLVQFLIESALMSLAGGVAGIVTGVAVSVLLSGMAGWAVKVTPYSVVLSSVFSMMVGVCFGLWPAVIASRLNPIEALRYE
ncbi:MAG: ATP-binding cassette domain-containing protein [Spirochaetes bacterium]|nr:MAG: ATP-binding cassette domain-containing protein [Spirochaetota bacterium]